MRRPGPLRTLRFLLSTLTGTLVAAALGAGCYSAGQGVSPPAESIYFPIGLGLVSASDGTSASSTAPDYLIVANSDFDLQYNAGTLQVFSLSQLLLHVPKPCQTDSDCASDWPGVDANLRQSGPDHPGPLTMCDTTASATPADPSGAGNSGVPSFVCVNPSFPRPCVDLQEWSTQGLSGQQLLYPTRCMYLDPTTQALSSELLGGRTVQIGAFATDAVYRPWPLAAPNLEGRLGRVFIPVRGNATLTWADINPDGSIECGQANASGACDGTHLAGNDADRENTRDLRLGPEPFGLDVSPLGDAVLVTNQTTGAVSLFSNDWTLSETHDVNLQYAVTGLPLEPVGAAALPIPALVTTNVPTAAISQGTSDGFDNARSALALTYPPGFLVSFRNAAEIDLIRYFTDSSADPARAYASRASASAITVNSVGSDSRGIAVDDSVRRAAELACIAAQGSPAAIACNLDAVCLTNLSDGDKASIQTCLATADANPVDVFVANRAPPTLLLGRTTPAINAFQSSELPTFYDSIPLTLGPSRVVIGSVIVGTDANGQAIHERRVFIVCFDSKRIFVYDPDRRRMDIEITTGRGPHALSIDAERGLLYVGHFTDSFIGVISIDRRFPRTYGKMLGMLGKPVAPRASK